MSLRKLTAGDGYSYLTRQVAAHDSTEKGHTSLADYYDEKGESPGRWMGSGLAGLAMTPGEAVTAPQMKSLFGLGMHPNAGAIEEQIAERGGTRAEVEAAIALGKKFLVHNTPSVFNVRVARGVHDVQPRAPAEVERPDPARGACPHPDRDRHRDVRRGARPRTAGRT